MSIKIATLNLCLGLKNKREELKRLLNNIGIDIMCLQETKIESEFTREILNIRNYRLELENNSVMIFFLFVL